MAMRSKEFVGKAEGIKSHELSVKSLIESIKGTLSSLTGKKNSLERELSSLYAELAAAENDYDDDDGPDYGLIASIERQIDQTNDELETTEGDISETTGELEKAEQEYEKVEEEKQQTLFEIQQRARTYSQDIAKIGGAYGAYATIGQSISQSMQANYDALSKAATILDGSIDCIGSGKSSSGGGSGGGNGPFLAGSNGAAAIAGASNIRPSNSSTSSMRSSQGSVGNSSNGSLKSSHGGNIGIKPPSFTSSQASINTRSTYTDSKKNASAAMIANASDLKSEQEPCETSIAGISHTIGSDKGTGEQLSVAKKSIKNSRQASIDAISQETKSDKEHPQKSPFSHALKSVSAVFGRGDAKTFSDYQIARNPYQKDIWDVTGDGYSDYCKYRSNLGDYTTSNSRYGNGIVKEVDINYIEGITVSSNDVKDPQLFWGRESGKTMDTFIEIASYIPEVKEKLLQGYKIDVLREDPVLGKCASIYFDPDSPSAPTLYKGDGFYEFVGNGRHRILAARYLGYSFPMRVVGEIIEKNPRFEKARSSYVSELRLSQFSSHNTAVQIDAIRNTNSVLQLQNLAKRLNVADEVDFGKLDLKVSQQIAESLFKTKTIFPNLQLDLRFVGSIQARNEFAVRECAGRLLKYYTDSYKTSNPNASKEECKKYAVLQTRQKLRGLKPQRNTIAQSISISPSNRPVSKSDKILIEAIKGISINESFGYSDTSFRKEKVEEIISGHKPQGCNTAKATIDHEIGHQIANALNAANDPYIKQEFYKFDGLSRNEQAKVLSTYAGEEHKIGEFLAECWSEFQNNPECRPLAKKISNRMIELYTSSFGSTTPKTKGFERDVPVRER